MDKRTILPLFTFAVVLLFSIPTFAQPPVIANYYGNGPFDRFGRAVDGGQDVDGDGTPDLLVSSRMVSNSTGAAYVYSGATNALLYTFNGSVPGGEFGEDAAMAGDVNADGYADIIVGAPSVNSFTGTATVFSGQNGTVLYTFNGNSPNSVFGRQVDGAGDVNLDGYADFIVGAEQDSTGGSNAGQVKVYSGFNGAVLYTINGGSLGGFISFVGSAVAGAGDVNLDGYDDFILGHLNDQLAVVYSGFDGSVLYNLPTTSLTTDDFGSIVDGAGDVNGDGYADFVIGAPLDDTVATDAGAVHVFSGINGALLFTAFGSTAGQSFGNPAGVGDVDGDGADDILIGAPQHNSPFNNAGLAQVWSGATGTMIEQLEGDEINEEFGWSVGPAGDVSGDGFADLIVGARQDTTVGPLAGRAAVFTLCGAVQYGLAASGFNTISLQWTPGTNGIPSNGAISLTGGVAGSAGTMFIARSPTYQLIGGFTVLVNLIPGSWFSLPFTSGAGGVSNFPVDLRTAGSPGSIVFLQGLENQGAGQYRLSHGLAVRFCP